MPVDQNSDKNQNMQKIFREKMLDVIATRKPYIISMLPWI